MPYHEQISVAALQRRGSPLWQVLAAQQTSMQGDEKLLACR
jgi:hypothetical protein